MYTHLRLFLFIFLSFLGGFCPKPLFALSKPHELLLGKIPESNARYRTFVHVLKLLEERNAQVLVETGTARDGCKNCIGDGCATLIFGNWAKEHGSELYSIDIDSNALLNAEQALGESLSFVHLVHSDSVTFLKNFQAPIDFLYLDSFDFDINNPFPSQQHHLNEIIAAYPLLTEKSVVMIDDCKLPFGGKGKLVIKYLKEKGWKVLMDDYQVILVKS